MFPQLISFGSLQTIVSLACPISQVVQSLGTLTALRARTREEEADWRVAGVTGLAIPGSGFWMLDLGRRVKKRKFSSLLYGERPCPSVGVLKTEQDMGGRAGKSSSSCGCRAADLHIHNRSDVFLSSGTRTELCLWEGNWYWIHVLRNLDLTAYLMQCKLHGFKISSSYNDLRAIEKNR